MLSELLMVSAAMMISYSRMKIYSGVQGFPIICVFLMQFMFISILLILLCIWNIYGQNIKFSLSYSLQEDHFFYSFFFSLFSFFSFSFLFSFFSFFFSFFLLLLLFFLFLSLFFFFCFLFLFFYPLLFLLLFFLILLLLSSAPLSSPFSTLLLPNLSDPLKQQVRMTHWHTCRS